MESENAAPVGVTVNVIIFLPLLFRKDYERSWNLCVISLGLIESEIIFLEFFELCEMENVDLQNDQNW
jgi:hypothetical protein